MAPFNDAPAQPLLVEVMAAAGRHDGDECLRLLAEAESHLLAGKHKARPDIEAARAAVAERDWRQVHGFAWAATAGLTWAWAPDPAVCPLAPGDTPHATTCACGTDFAPQAKFCSTCGTAR